MGCHQFQLAPPGHAEYECDTNSVEWTLWCGMVHPIHAFLPVIRHLIMIYHTTQWKSHVETLKIALWGSINNAILNSQVIAANTAVKIYRSVPIGTGKLKVGCEIKMKSRY